MPRRGIKARGVNDRKGGYGGRLCGALGLVEREDVDGVKDGDGVRAIRGMQVRELKGGG